MYILGTLGKRKCFKGTDLRYGAMYYYYLVDYIWTFNSWLLLLQLIVLYILVIFLHRFWHRQLKKNLDNVKSCSCFSFPRPFIFVLICFFFMWTSFEFSVELLLQFTRERLVLVHVNVCCLDRVSLDSVWDICAFFFFLNASLDRPLRLWTPRWMSRMGRLPCLERLATDVGFL